jgi:hypothetical protein
MHCSHIDKGANYTVVLFIPAEAARESEHASIVSQRMAGTGLKLK